MQAQFRPPRFVPNASIHFEDDGGLPFTLTEPLIYDSVALGYRRVLVPKGFKTDLASIPRLLWNILPPLGRYDAAAVVHDCLYQRAPRSVSRGMADATLREAMKVLGVSGITRWVIYAGVRIGGWVPWNQYRRPSHRLRPGVVNCR